jgi:hypothetical protein
MTVFSSTRARTVGVRILMIPPARVGAEALDQPAGEGRRLSGCHAISPEALEVLPHVREQRAARRALRERLRRDLKVALGVAAVRSGVGSPSVGDEALAIDRSSAAAAAERHVAAVRASISCEIGRRTLSPTRIKDNNTISW